MSTTSDDQPPGESSDGNGFAAVFSSALERRGVTLSWLREQLVHRGSPVSLATLSYWRSGARTPERTASMQALADLEGLLQLPRGHLQRAVGPTGRGVPSLPPAGAGILRERHPRVDEALAELGLSDWSNGLQTLLIHSTLDLDHRGGSRSMGTRALYRATRPGIDRYAQVLFFEQPMRARPPYRQVHGSVPGRSVEHPGAGLFVVEMLLPRPLALGETFMAEQVVDLPGSMAPEDQFSHYVLRRVPELLLWVRFDPRMPLWEWECFAETEDGLTVAPVDVTGRYSVHHSLRGFGPGAAGIRWHR